MSQAAFSCIEALESRTLLAAGALVTGFGQNGVAIGRVECSYDDTPVDAAVEGDGDLVVLTKVDGVGYGLVRFLPNGEIDPNFGNEGRVLSRQIADPVAVAIQPSGKILVAGTNSQTYSSAESGEHGYTSAAVMRFNADGSPDATFGTVQRFDTGGDPDNGYMDMLSRVLEVMPGGDILLGYEVQGIPNFMYMERLNADGNGIWRTGGPFMGSHAAIAIEDDGAVLKAWNEGFGGYLLRRTGADGSADAGFGTAGGSTALAFASTDMAITGDRIWVVGLSGPDQSRSLAISSFTLTGLPDTDFGDDGTVLASLPPGIYTRADFLPDGSIFVLGRDASHLLVARFNSAGQIDGAFGQDGVLTTAVPATGPGIAPAILPTGGFAVIGTTSSDATGLDIAVEWFSASGAPSIAYAAVDSSGPGTTSMIDTAAIPGGHTAILASAGGNRVLMRYSNTGKLVKNFGAGGIVTGVPFGSRVAADQQGRVYVAGVVGDSVLVRRYTARGRLDVTFDGAGTASAGVWSVVEQDPPVITSMLVQDDGGILIGFQTRERSRIARLTGLGRLDKRFGSQGVVSLAAISGLSQGIDLALQPNGRIVAVRHIDAGRSILMRLLPTGRRDYTFGVKGVVETGWDARHVAIDPDGRVVLSGQATIGVGLRTKMILARYDSRGRLDRAFGTRGRAAYAIADKSVAASSLAVQEDGLILAGTREAMLRFNVRGRIDSTFARKGVFTPRIGPKKTPGSVMDIMVRLNGEIITGGNAGSDLYLARVSS